MMKASRVPMLTSSPRTLIGIKAAKIATKVPTMIEEIQGELRPRLAPYLHGEALDYPAQTDIATAWR